MKIVKTKKINITKTHRWKSNQGCGESLVKETKNRRNKLRKLLFCLFQDTKIQLPANTEAMTKNKKQKSPISFIPQNVFSKTNMSTTVDEIITDNKIRKELDYF